jgi:hypothetical protein
MKRFTNTISSLLIAMALLTSCGENAVKENSGSETLTKSDFSSEELASAVETLSISYSITVISDDNSEVEINNDADLTSYSKRYGKAKIKFPIEITVDGEIILVEDHKELKALILRKKKGHRHTSFKLVYPISVKTAEGVLEIADRGEMKTYKQSLEKGVRLEFVFPISVKVGEDEIEVNSKEALKKLFKKRKRRGHKRRKLVYPISVNTAEGVLEIADREAMKTYKQSLEKGVRPEFVFPISVTVGEDEIEVNSKEALKKLFQKRKRRGRK